MIARIIENWLINTNESFIRTAFCQLLLNEGHDVKNIHGNLEHGKDIISIDGNGEYNAYQLKKGNIDIESWRDIEPQINELIEYPIDHVGFDPDKSHIPYLVISGTVNSIANNAIRLYNQSKNKRGFPKLEIIDKNQLIKRFRESQGKFIPKEFDDFYTFLDILTIDGTNFLPKKLLFEFLDNVIFNEIPHYRYDRINAISSSLIFLSYLLERFQQSENYYALFEAWIILAGCIIRFGKKARLRSEEFESSLGLIIENVTETLKLLKDEILAKNDFFEGKDAFDSSKTYGARTVIVLGTLSCLELYHQQTDELYEKDIKFLDIIKNNINKALFWGESAFPYYFYLIKYLELNDEKERSNQLLEELLLILIEKNYYTSKKGLPNIYYDVNVVVESIIREDIEDYIKQSQKLSILSKMTKNKLNNLYFLPVPKMTLGENGLINYLSGNQNIRTKTVFENNEEVIDVFKENNDTSTDEKLILSFKKILEYSNLGKIDYTLFPSSSYILETIILMLSRRGNRVILADNWRKLSHINFDVMEIENIEDTFIWYANGSNKVIIPNEKQSWKELVEKSTLNGSIPEIYDEFFYILQFFILAVPHRINKNIIGLIDSRITND